MASKIRGKKVLDAAVNGHILSVRDLIGQGTDLNVADDVSMRFESIAFCTAIYNYIRFEQH